jgi:acyl-CoA thioesterase-1
MASELIFFSSHDNRGPFNRNSRTFSVHGMDGLVRKEHRTMRLMSLIGCCLLANWLTFGAETDRKTIVILGDSIAAGNGVELSEAFPGLVQQRIDEKKLPYEVVNAGVSGDTTAGGVRRMPWLLKRKVDVLVIELGGNDGLRGISPEETRANIEKIISLAREKYPEVRIVLAGMQMPQNMGAEYNRKFSELFPAIAKEKKTELIPFLLEGVGGKPELNQPDRIHPNAEGHKIVAENVWSVIGPMLPPHR